MKKSTYEEVDAAINSVMEEYLTNKHIVITDHGWTEKEYDSMRWDKLVEKSYQLLPQPERTWAWCCNMFMFWILPYGLHSPWLKLTEWIRNIKGDRE